jgi:microsomal dipeptidase-like Zn-dependent dipeptidase
MALGSGFDGCPELPREIEEISDYLQMTMSKQKPGYSNQLIKRSLG